MAPKPDAKADKARAAAMAKKIEDKTFGMKNKNKSKQVQQQIAQMKQAAGMNKHESNDDKKKKAADQAINEVLFKEAVTKKELARRALEKAAAKAKEAAKEKEPDKRDIYVDQRDLKASKEEDSMENWDDEKLKQVVNAKKGGQGERVKTDIICKHFLEAVEKRQYGWFWECPNGGDKCQYRHALPDGYVLKRDRVDEVIDEGPTLEDQIEEQRKQLKTRTPVTFERLQEWLAKKKAEQQAAEDAVLEAARKQYAKGKASGVSGKMLFTIDQSLFVDDAAAGADRYVREDSDDEDGEGGGGGSGSGGGGASSSGGGTPGKSLAATSGGGYLGGAEPEPEPDLDVCPPAEPDSAAGAGSSSSGAVLGDVYSANYDEKGKQPAVDVTDLAGVDESLFLDDDLPDDDELE